ncbi:MAG TPA: hypothetical protein VGC21_11980 [Telluria sp.]|jgi:hypothetical protein
MNRNLFLRVLLSLLLLVSQQSAMSHAVSHWTGSADQAAQAQTNGKRTLPNSVIDDAGCAQCLTYAQMASAVGSPSYVLPALDIGSVHQIAAIPSADCIRTVCVFQSRAPPQA